MKEALMKSINLKKYSFLVLILFLLEIGFSCLLAGGFNSSVNSSPCSSTPF